MVYRVSLSNKARKDLRKIHAKDQKRIKAAIQELGASLPDRPPNWSVLRQGTPPNVRYDADGKLTVGKYRILTIILDQDNTVVIPRIFVRGDSEYGFTEAEESVEAPAEPSPILTRLQESARVVIRRILLGLR